MNEELITIIHDFEKSGQVLVEGKRNKIKIFQYRGITINVKSFKVPILINGLIYKSFRKSKAKRSFENAQILINKGIGTPKPIAFYENFNWLLLRESYYICEQLQPDLVFKNFVENTFRPDSDEILKGIAKFSYLLHENGIEFLDHSPGNTLIKKNQEGVYEFYLVDLNRMKFHDAMSFDLRMKNLSRLTPSKEMIKVISTEYARLYNKNPEEVFELLWKYTFDFQKKYYRKIKIKKRLLFWR